MKTLTFEIKNLTDTDINNVAQQLGYEVKIKKTTQKSLVLEKTQDEINQITAFEDLIQDNNPYDIIQSQKSLENGNIELTLEYTIDLEEPNPQTIQEFLQNHFVENYAKGVLLNSLKEFNLKTLKEQQAKELEIAEKQIMETAETNIDVITQIK